MSEQYPDLGISQSQDGDYWDIVIPDLDFDTAYSLQAAWSYSDKTKGESEYSDRYNFTTPQQEGLLAPRFISTDLYGENSILYISWNGQDSGGDYYLESVLKQVNIWIKGGDFGDEYVRFGTFGDKAGTVTVNATKKSTYCVKLQAESKNGDFSPFSPEFCLILLEQPDPVFSVRHEWVKRDLVLFWKFDVNLPKNSLSDSFAVQLIADGKDITLYTNVDNTKVPPLEHKIVFTESRLAAIFGQVTAFQTDYDAFIFVRDKNLQTSTVVGYQASAYVDPLTAPVISVIKGPLSYNISFTNNSEFDRIFIEDSVDSGVTWVDRGSSSSNPVYVSSGSSEPRQVRARFSKVRGGLTGYSNIVTVTPDPLVSFNDQAPNKPTSFSGSGSVDGSGVIGFNGVINFTWTPDASSSNVRGYRIRFRPYKATAPFEEFSYVDSPGTGTKYRLSGLAVGTTYEIAVGSFNEFNKESVSYTSGTNVLVPGTPFIGTNVTTTGYFEAFPGSGNTSNAFRFGYGVESGKRGITFNANNYWYIDSDASALFKLGGDDENYIQWNGQTFIIQGDLRAKKGNFSGGVEIKSGGSLFSGVMNQSQSNITGSGFILNNNGLKFSSSTVPDITTISGTTGRLVTTSADIGGWAVGTSTISSSGITLTSGSTPGSTSIVAGNAGGYVGIKPKGTAGSDIVLWAGTTQSPSANSASSGQAGFQVNADGQLYATGAIISGKIIVQSGSSLGGLLDETSKVYYSATTPAVPSGGHKAGDSWVDTANSNQLKIWSGTAWVVAQDSEAVKTIVNTKTKTTYGPTQPATAIAGDVWFDTTAGINYFKVYNGTQWVRMKDSDITAAAQAAADALTESNKKSTTTSSQTAPTAPKAGDIWFDTNFNYFKVWSTTVTPAAWVRLKDGDLTAAETAIQTANQNASNALSKAALFGVDGSLVSNMVIENSGAAIYSRYNSGGLIAKSSYSSTNAGFYLGWDNQAGVLYPAFNIGNANAYMKWSNYDQTLRIKGNISLNAGSDIDGATVADVKAGATAGSNALQPGGNLTGTIGGTPVADIKSGATAGSTAAQPGNGVTLKNDGSKQINQIDLLASGIKISSATTGTRVEMSNSGLYLYKGTSTTPTVALSAATGDAQFTGTVNASGGTFSGNITASGTISGGTISGSSIIGGTVTAGTTNGSSTGFGNIKLNGANRNLEFLNSNGTVIGRMFSWADNETIIAPGGDSGYPISSAFLSLAANVRTASLIITGAQGQSIGEMKLNSVHSVFSGVSVYTTQGAPISTSSTYNDNNGYYFRNIGMGTGAKATTDTDGLRGDIWIQYT